MAGKLEAGTVAVSVLGLTYVVSANWVPFHKMNAPVTKPVPVAVMGRPPAGIFPIVAVLGLTKVSVEEDV